MNIWRQLMNSIAYDAADKSGGTGGDPNANPDGNKSTNIGDGKDPPSDKSGGGGDDAWKGLVKDQDNLAYIKTKGWQDPDGAVKSYRDLETQFSQTKLPTKDSTPEELDSFFNKLGRPEKSEGYQFKISDKVPEHFPYEEQSANDFKGIAHKARLTAEQAQVLHDWYVDKQVGFFSKDVETTKTRVEAAHDLLVKDFGDPKGENYKRNVELADRSVRELGRVVDPKNPSALRKELADIGAITPDGKVMAPLLIKALSKVGADLFHEDKVYSGLSSTENPWKTDDLTKQGRIMQEDPELARQLILAANLKPSDYGLK